MIFEMYIEMAQKVPVNVKKYEKTGLNLDRDKRGTVVELRASKQLQTWDVNLFCR